MSSWIKKLIGQTFVLQTVHFQCTTLMLQVILFSMQKWVEGSTSWNGKNFLDFALGPLDGPWKFRYVPSEIISLESAIQVVYHHVVGSANDLDHSLAKQAETQLSLWLVLGWSLGFLVQISCASSLHCSLFNVIGLIKENVLVYSIWFGKFCLASFLPDTNSTPITSITGLSNGQQ